MAKSCKIGTLPSALVQSCSLFAENRMLSWARSSLYWTFKSWHLESVNPQETVFLFLLNRCCFEPMLTCENHAFWRPVHQKHHWNWNYQYHGDLDPPWLEKPPNILMVLYLLPQNNEPYSMSCPCSSIWGNGNYHSWDSQNLWSLKFHFKRRLPLAALLPVWYCKTWSWCELVWSWTMMNTNSTKPQIGPSSFPNLK